MKAVAENDGEKEYSVGPAIVVGQSASTPSFWASPSLRKAIRKTTRQVLFYAGLLGLWALVAKLRIWPPYLFPAPWSVGEVLVDGFKDHSFLIGIAATMKRMLIGYGLSVVLGMILGIAVASNKFMEEYTSIAKDSFSFSEEKFLKLTQCLSSSETMRMRHSALENLITVEGRELLRRLFEEHIKLRGYGDIGNAIRGSDGINRAHKRIRQRILISVFGEITIERMGYSARGGAFPFCR